MNIKSRTEAYFFVKGSLYGQHVEPQILFEILVDLYAVGNSWAYISHISEQTYWEIVGARLNAAGNG